MEKIVMIGGREVKLRATAAVPRLYRMKFNRDLIKDTLRVQKIFDDAKAANPDGDSEKIGLSSLQEMDLSLFENIAYIMARHADPQKVPNDPEDWLAQFEGMELYASMGEILGFWAESMKGSVQAKKN